MRVKKIEKRFSSDQLILGADLAAWLRILEQGEWNVSADYAHRLAWISSFAAASSVMGAMDDMRFGRQLATMETKPTPLFVLGHWRSGTTHMHDLLGRDPNNTFTTLWQVIFPTSFLSNGRMGPKLLKGALPEHRSYDNMKMGWFEPAEDEIALMKLHGMSFYGALMFPDSFAKYEKYIDFLECTEAERQEWKSTFEWFIKKVILATGGKRVVVKSCAHSARIRMILDLFPDAKFVHIHRHPFRVFRSMLHMRSKVDWENFLQRPKQEFMDLRREHTAAIGERVFTRLVEDRALIPPENLIEVPYHQFCGNEGDWLNRIYDQLGMPDKERYLRSIQPYLDSLRGYQVNKLELDDELKELCYDRWRIVFDTYGYTPEEIL